eukprot:615548-Lingulodinium_polyedra.AAC.1
MWPTASTGQEEVSQGRRRSIFAAEENGCSGPENAGSRRVDAATAPNPRPGSFAATPRLWPPGPSLRHAIC